MDSQGRVAFQFQALSYQPVAEGMYLVFLKETNGNRLFPISLDEKQKSFIEQTISLRPTEQKKLLETFRICMGVSGNILEDVTIDNTENGNFTAQIHFLQNGETFSISSSAPQAIAIALTFHSTLYVCEDLLSVCRANATQGSVSFPLSSINTDMLKKAMKDAVEREEYELAANLRDELNKRK